MTATDAGPGTETATESPSREMLAAELAALADDWLRQRAQLRDAVHKASGDERGQIRTAYANQFLEQLKLPARSVSDAAAQQAMVVTDYDPALFTARGLEVKIPELRKELDAWRSNVRMKIINFQSNSKFSAAQGTALLELLKMPPARRRTRFETSTSMYALAPDDSTTREDFEALLREIISTELRNRGYELHDNGSPDRVSISTYVDEVTA